MTVRILEGDVRAMLRTLAPESVHCIWTSVPYWALRSYDTEPQVWGGDEACSHEWAAAHRPARNGAGRHGATSELIRQSRAVTEAQVGSAQASKGQFCSKCGAWLGEHGLEPTFALWLEHQVTVWRELRRVLRKDGVAWLNCGDAYASSTNGRSAAATRAKGTDDRTFRDKPISSAQGLRAKQRLMMPARLAITLQADGWWLRDEVVWHKPNPMPSSVRDRTTPAHEMLYMLTRSARYFYDAVAIMEESTGGAHPRSAKKPAGWDTGPGAHLSFHREGRAQRKLNGTTPKASLVNGQGPGFPKSNASFNAALGHADLTATRNKRSVWTIATEPFPAAHFATAPTSLVEPCLRAATSEKGCCSSCGTPWTRMVRRSSVPDRRGRVGHAGDTIGEAHGEDGRAGDRRIMVVHTLGWRPGCKCDAAIVPCTVLDPFGGAGTTALVADRLQRDAIQIDLQPTYNDIARRRIADDAGLLAQVGA